MVRIVWVVLIGNFNVGKMMFFNVLMGLWVKTVNYLGIMVDVCLGMVVFFDLIVELIDLSGFYSLDVLMFEEKVVEVVFWG